MSGMEVRWSGSETCPNAVCEYSPKLFEIDTDLSGTPFPTGFQAANHVRVVKASIRTIAYDGRATNKVINVALCDDHLYGELRLQIAEEIRTQSYLLDLEGII